MWKLNFSEELLAILSLDDEEGRKTWREGKQQPDRPSILNSNISSLLFNPHLLLPLHAITLSSGLLLHLLPQIESVNLSKSQTALVIKKERDDKERIKCQN